MNKIEACANPLVNQVPSHPVQEMHHSLSQTITHFGMKVGAVFKKHVFFQSEKVDTEKRKALIESMFQTPEETFVKLPKRTQKDLEIRKTVFLAAKILKKQDFCERLLEQNDLPFLCFAQRTSDLIDDIDQDKLFKMRDVVIAETLVEDPFLSHEPVIQQYEARVVTPERFKEISPILVDTLALLIKTSQEMQKIWG